METQELEARVKELEDELGNRKLEIGELNAKIEEMQTEIDEQKATIDGLSQEAEKHKDEGQFVTVGKEVMEATKADILKISAQVDGEDFNKELVEQQLSALGNDWSALKQMKEGLEKRRAKMFKAGELNPDETHDTETKPEQDYKLGQKIGKPSLVLAKK